MSPANKRFHLPGIPRRIDKQRLFWFSKLVASFGILLLLVSTLDLRSAWHSLSTIQPLLVCLAILLFYPTQLLATLRWKYVLAQFGQHLAFWTLFRYAVWGQVSALLLPGQLSGDVIRTVAVARGRDSKTTLVLAAVVDKTSALIAILACALIGLLFHRLAALYAFLYWPAVILLCGSVLVLLLFCGWGKRFRDLMAYATSWAPRAAFLGKWLSPLNTYRVPATKILVIASLGLLVQLFNSVGSYFMAMAFSIQIDPIAWVAIGAIVSLGQMLPFTLGGVGIREGLFVALLAPYGIPTAQSLSYSVFGFVCVALLLVAAWYGNEWLYQQQSPNASSVAHPHSS